VRILQIHNRYRERGGEDAVVAAEAQLLRDAGHEVVEYQVENPPGRVEAAGALALSAWNPFAARRVRDLAEQIRPDVAHVHNTWFSLSPAVFRALRQSAVPVVMTLHNYRLLCANGMLFRDGAPCEQCVGSHPWHGLWHGCYRGSIPASALAAGAIAVHRAVGTWKRHVDSFLTLTEFARDLAVRGGLPAHRVTVKPNFASDPGARSKRPSASGTVLYVGRLAEEKGILGLLDGWKAAAVSGLELMVVGDGPLRSRVADCAPPGVQVVGRLAPDKVRNLMLTSRALVFPSHLYEGQPMAVLEALASGLPVLASGRGGIAATLQGTGSAWLIEPGEPGAWRTGLARLSEGDAVDAAGHWSRGLYERLFTPERALLRLEAVYRAAMDRLANR
jgi:glycosyltransferase involved in cell wall biosynthesis